jgi:hypothetical protein
MEWARMERPDRPSISAAETCQSSGRRPSFAAPPAVFRLRAHDVQIYRVCDGLTEPLIYLMVLFGPWAFGTTQRWSIWIMNVAGYTLGLLLVIKLSVCAFKGHQPPRWIRLNPPRSESTKPESRFQLALWIARGLAGLTSAILGFCLLSAINARATYYSDRRVFEYHDCLQWLPHSFDSTSTWFAFWMYLGLACSFWAIRDWLLGKSRGEELAQWRKPGSTRLNSTAPVPTRLRRLLWVLAINGGLLAVESLIQRLANSPRLLFLVLPQIHQTAETQFGPYAYRANAAQYFNLAWPVCLGFWWTLNRASAHRKGRHVLLICGSLMAACPIVSTSRGGAIVAFGMVALGGLLILATHFLLRAHKTENRRTRSMTLAALLLFFGTALLLGVALGWKALKPRLAEIDVGFAGRERDYETVRRMAQDYPWFGVGPGAYETVSELYLPPTGRFWPAQVHNDWLETQITFGWIGSVMIWTALGLALARWFAPTGIHSGRRFMLLTWMAIAGCLTHARFDFPFQVHSVLSLFLMLCAILCTVSRRPWAE